MFSEFFWKSGFRTACVAWGGLAVVLGYSIFLAWIKSLINDFYSDFYDLMQESGTVAAHDYGSGGGGDDESDVNGGSSSLAEYRARVWAELLRFARIVTPLVFASPAAKWARSAWAFSWRAALMKRYLKAWDISKEPIEGASQRLHEDSQRFANALQGCLATLLDAIFTLGVFRHPRGPERPDRAALWLGALRGAWRGAGLLRGLVGLGGGARGQKLVPGDQQPKGRGRAAQGPRAPRDDTRRDRRHALRRGRSQEPTSAAA